MSDKIKEALQKLDVSNDNHWTQDGLAKLETVKFFTGGESVSREQIDEGFPNFNRTTASAFFMDLGTKIASEETNAGEPAAPATRDEHGKGELTESPRGEGAGGTAEASQPGGEPAGLPETETEQPEVAEREPEPDEIETLETAIRQAEETLDAIRGEIHSLKSDVAEGEDYVGRLRTRLAAIKPAENQSATISAYLNSVKEKLTARGEARATLKESGLTLKAIAQAIGKSPIDQAMARKTGRGGHRPTR